VAGLHAGAEVFRGDPHDPRTNYPTAQVGFRYIFNDTVQVEGTFGSTLTAVATDSGHSEPERWGRLRLRLVTPEHW
jgi:hypothetical protein